MPRQRRRVELAEKPAEVAYDEAVLRIGLATGILAEVAERLKRRRLLAKRLPIIIQPEEYNTFVDNFAGTVWDWLTM